MSANHSTATDNPINVLKLPLQRDENGKAVIYIDPNVFIQHITPVEKPTVVKKTIKVELPNATPTPTPEQIFDNASQYILYQDNALKALSTILYYHLESKRHYHTDLAFDSLFGNFSANQHASQANFYAQAPIFLTGKTGSGKTHLIKQLCRLYDMNFITVNSASLSNAGYKGYTLADVGYGLLQSAKQNRIKAEYSVVFFDEFDKLFLDTTQSANLGMYHRSLVTEILTIIEGTTHFPIKDEEGLDSSKMLFILGGSFNMHQADEKLGMGFTAEKQLQQNPDTQLKLTDFGLPDELAGRIGKIIAMQDIEEAQMIELLLKSPTSPFIAFEAKLALVDCTVSIQDDALEALLLKQKEAIKKFGVRGIYQGFNELPQLVDILYNAPDFPKTHYTITSEGFYVTRDEMATAKAKAERLLAEKQRKEAEMYDVPF